MVKSLNNEITVCAEKIDSKSKESEKRTSELVGMEKKHKESICRSSSELEKKVKEIKAAETEVSGFYARSEKFRKEIEDKEKELDLLKNQIESEAKRLLHLRKVTELRKKDLEVNLSKIKESNQQLASVNEQLDLKSKELEEIERELKLKKLLRHMNTVFVKREKQPQEENEPIDDDTLMPDGISASLTRHEVSSFLRASSNPAEVGEGSAFQDTFLETLVLLFDELAKTQRPDTSTQLQASASARTGQRYDDPQQTNSHQDFEGEVKRRKSPHYLLGGRTIA